MSINNKLYVRSEYIANKNINSPSEIKVLLLNFSKALPVTPQSYRTLLGFLHLLDGVKGRQFFAHPEKTPISTCGLGASRRQMEKLKTIGWNNETNQTWSWFDCVCCKSERSWRAPPKATCNDPWGTTKYWKISLAISSATTLLLDLGVITLLPFRVCVRINNVKHRGWKTHRMKYESPTLAPAPAGHAS